MPQKALDIFVAGGFDEADPNALGVDREKIVSFAGHLRRDHSPGPQPDHRLPDGGRQAAGRIGGRRDRPAAPASSPLSPRIVSYVRRGITPVTELGVRIESDVPEWNFGGREPTPPEVVANADVVVLLGGFFGTFQAANWARFAESPSCPSRCSAARAREVYGVESRRFDEVRERRLSGSTTTPSSSRCPPTGRGCQRRRSRSPNGSSPRQVCS